MPDTLHWRNNQDLNLRPLRAERLANATLDLPNLFHLVDRVGFEPTSLGLKGPPFPVKLPIQFGGQDRTRTGICMLKRHVDHPASFSPIWNPMRDLNSRNILVRSEGHFHYANRAYFGTLTRI